MILSCDPQMTKVQTTLHYYVATEANQLTSCDHGGVGCSNFMKTGTKVLKELDAQVDALNAQLDFERMESTYLG